MVHDLGWKHYGRYVDDFFIVARDDEVRRALDDVKAIEVFLRRLGLKLHPRKRSVQPADNGVGFLGGVVYPGRIYPGKRLTRNAGQAFREVVAGKRDPESVASYLGHMKYFAAGKMVAELFERAMWGLNQQFRGNYGQKYELMRFCWAQTIFDDENPLFLLLLLVFKLPPL